MNRCHALCASRRTGLKKTTRRCEGRIEQPRGDVEFERNVPGGGEVQEGRSDSGLCFNFVEIHIVPKGVNINNGIVVIISSADSKLNSDDCWLLLVEFNRPP